MKTTTLYVSFILSGILISLQGCKKLSSTPQPSDTTNITINPNTTQTIPDYDFNDTTLTNHGWNKTFEDNFDSDLSKWSTINGGLDGELECNKPDNAAIVNGVLEISAKRETVTGPVTAENPAQTKSFDFTSAWLISRTMISASVQTPRVRVVARMKVMSGNGLTSEVFTAGTNWPVNGEIICAETNNGGPTRFGTSYSYGTQANQNLVTNSFQYNPTTDDLSGAYHVYTMEWSKNSITYYIDGNLAEVKTVGGHVPDLFGKSQTIQLIAPVDRSSIKSVDPSTISGGTMYVDYIKVFCTKAL